MTLYRIEDLPLEPVGVGVYAIRDSAASYVADKDGRRLEINFNRAVADDEILMRGRRGSIKGAIPPWQRPETEVTP